MNPDMRWMAVETERKPLPTGNERARRLAEASAAAARTAPGTARRARCPGAAVLVRLGARLRGGSRRERALGAPAAW